MSLASEHLFGKRKEINETKRSGVSVSSVPPCRPHTTRSASQYVRTDSHRFRAITYTLSYGSFSLTIHFRVARATAEKLSLCEPASVSSKFLSQNLVNAA